MKTIMIVMLMLLVCSWAAVVQAQAADEAGKKIFTDNKCNTCHSIDSAGIKSTMGEKSPAAKKGMADLSNVGSSHDAAWMIKYLKKEETIKDVKHVKGWAGSEADLKTLADWLATLKKKE